MKIGQERTIRRYAILPTWVYVGENGNKDKWVWLRSFYEKQKYEKWNDWQEGVGDHWKTSWRCQRQYI
jgi:hypothetical protein